jgi:hypothetical protein
MDIDAMLERDPKIGDTLYRLTGLTVEQYKLLYLACVGGLRDIHPATHKVMRAFIGMDLSFTREGYKLFCLVDAIAEESWYVGPRDCIQLKDNFQGCVKILRRWSDGRLRSAHLKALVAIYNDGCLSERFLRRVYGYSVVGELWRFGWTEIIALPEIEGWHIYRLSTLGDSLLQSLVLLQEGKSL